MVFYCIRIFPWVAGVCDVIDLRADFLRNIWACDNGRRTDRNWKGKYPKTAAAVFAVSFTCVTVDGAYEDDMRKTTCIKKYYSASITVEASIILSVVLLSLAAFIRYAYTVHDTVTGSMILEETLERARNNVNKKKTIDSFEQEGSQMGNPRLYLGAYELGQTIDNIINYNLASTIFLGRTPFTS